MTAPTSIRAHVGPGTKVNNPRINSPLMRIRTSLCIHIARGFAMVVAA
jgi:hypothetical protein